MDHNSQYGQLRQMPLTGMQLPPAWQQTTQPLISAQKTQKSSTGVLSPRFAELPLAAVWFRAVAAATGQGSNPITPICLVGINP
jgi:hypothetical protein